MLPLSLSEYSEDALYYLSTKVQSEYFGGRFSSRIAAWYGNREAMSKAAEYKQYQGGKNVPLKPDLKTFNKIDWEEVVLKRESKREFNGGAVPYSAISNLLLMSCGLKENGAWIRPSTKKSNRPRRALPSGGALYPLEYYILALNVSGLPKGLYHFNTFLSGLTLIAKDKSVLDFPALCSQRQFFNKPAAVIYTTAVFERSRAKYGPRALRFILLEAGGVNAQMCLLSAAMNLDCCTDGAGFEDKIEQMIGIDGRTEGLVSTFVLGRSQ